MRLFLLLLLLLGQNLTAQKLSPQVTARKDLMNLLQERKVLFDSYTASLRERSGIFGVGLVVEARPITPQRETRDARNIAIFVHRG